MFSRETRPIFCLLSIYLFREKREGGKWRERDREQGILLGIIQSQSDVPRARRINI